MADRQKSISSMAAVAMLKMLKDRKVRAEKARTAKPSREMNFDQNHNTELLVLAYLL